MSSGNLILLGSIDYAESRLLRLSYTFRDRVVEANEELAAASLGQEELPFLLVQLEPQRSGDVYHVKMVQLWVVALVFVILPVQLATLVRPQLLILHQFQVNMLLDLALETIVGSQNYQLRSSCLLLLPRASQYLLDLVSLALL